MNENKEYQKYSCMFCLYKTCTLALAHATVAKYILGCSWLLIL